jgi:hypothetical protein
MNLFLASIIVFLINIPFGYWRGKERKFSWQWFLTIHIPVPFLVLIRLYFDIGFAFYTYLIIIPVFLAGQFFGKKLNSMFSKKLPTSKNIFKDLLNIIKY